MFQSTRPYGARPPDNAEWQEMFYGFNPRARTGRDRGHAEEVKRPLWFQSTRPYGARHVRAQLIHDPVAVSIHAPVRGATLSFPVLMVTP